MIRDRVAVSQTVRFCRADDGVRIAFAVHGSGPPLVVNTCWLSHLEYDWQSPVWRHFVEELGKVATIVRYDERGHGMSDRRVDDLSLRARSGDLAAVVEAAGLDRFALLGMAQGAPVAVRYVIDHRERVTRLVLLAGYAKRVRDPEEEALFDTLAGLIRVGWATPDSRYRRVFTAGMIPGANELQKRWVDDLLPLSTTASMAVRAMSERRKVDVTDILPDVAVPTLVVHARGDQMSDFEEARRMASEIPNCRLIPLESDNHILLEHEPAWKEFLTELTAFLEPDRRQAVWTTEPSEALTAREVEVISLAAHGMGNDEIADDLGVSARTVERHMSNCYRKLGVKGASARAAAVAYVLTR